jgi:hypothetical protein
VRALQLAGAEGDLTCVAGVRVRGLEAALGCGLRRHCGFVGACFVAGEGNGVLIWVEGRVAWRGGSGKKYQAGLFCVCKRNGSLQSGLRDIGRWAAKKWPGQPG